MLLISKNNSFVFHVHQLWHFTNVQFEDTLFQFCFCFFLHSFYLSSIIENKFYKKYITKPDRHQNCEITQRIHQLKSLKKCLNSRPILEKMVTPRPGRRWLNCFVNVLVYCNFESFGYCLGYKIWLILFTNLIHLRKRR